MEEVVTTNLTSVTLFMILVTCIMLPFRPITSPAGWGCQFCTFTVPADLLRPLPVLLPLFGAVRIRTVHCTNCRNTMDLYSSTVIFPVLFPIFFLLPDICLSVDCWWKTWADVFTTLKNFKSDRNLTEKKPYHCIQVKSAAAWVT